MSHLSTLRPRSQSLSRVLVLCALFLTSSFLGRSEARPDNPFAKSVPTAQTSAPKNTPTQDGKFGVGTKTGVATYGVNIVLPPGRQDMAPGVSLQYASDGKELGGLAVGWSFDAGATISRDPEAMASHAYRSSLGGRRIGFNANQIDNFLTHLHAGALGLLIVEVVELLQANGTWCFETIDRSRAAYNKYPVALLIENLIFVGTGEALANS